MSPHAASRDCPEAPLDAIIIGAGVSGLARAWSLKQAGKTVCVLEKNLQPGGAVRSVRSGEWLAEEGPHTLQIGTAALEAKLATVPGLLEEAIDAAPNAKKRFLVCKGRATAVPGNPIAAFTTPLLSLKGKLRFLREPFVPRPNPPLTNETIAHFTARRLGAEAFERLIDPLIGGIYAGDGNELLVRHAFPRLQRLEDDHGSLMRGALALMQKNRRAAKAMGGQPFRKRIVSFPNGLQTIPDSLAKALGDAVNCGCTVESIVQVDDGWEVAWRSPNSASLQKSRAPQLFISTPAYALASLPFADSLQSAIAKLPTLQYPPVSVLTLGFPRSAIQHPLDGFGVLIPTAEQFPFLGVLFPSTLFAGRAPGDHVTLTIFIGGRRNPELASPDVNQLVDVIRPKLNSLLHINPAQASVFQHLCHWPHAIPQYGSTYPSFIESIEHIETVHTGLHFIGNHRGGIALPACLENNL